MVDDLPTVLFVGWREIFWLCGGGGCDSSCDCAVACDCSGPNREEVKCAHWGAQSAPLRRRVSQCVPSHPQNQVWLEEKAAGVNRNTAHHKNGPPTRVILPGGFCSKSSYQINRTESAGCVCVCVYLGLAQIGTNRKKVVPSTKKKVNPFFLHDLQQEKIGNCTKLNSQEPKENNMPRRHDVVPGFIVTKPESSTSSLGFHRQRSQNVSSHKSVTRSRSFLRSSRHHHPPPPADEDDALTNVMPFRHLKSFWGTLQETISALLPWNNHFDDQHPNPKPRNRVPKIITVPSTDDFVQENESHHHQENRDIQRRKWTGRGLNKKSPPTHAVSTTSSRTLRSDGVWVSKALVSSKKSSGSRTSWQGRKQPQRHNGIVARASQSVRSLAMIPTKKTGKKALTGNSNIKRSHRRQEPKKQPEEDSLETRSMTTTETDDPREECAVATKRANDQCVQKKGGKDKAEEGEDKSSMPSAAALLWNSASNVFLSLADCAGSSIRQVT